MNNIPNEYLELYRIQVDMLEKMAERRVKSNQFYISTMSIIAGFLTFYSSQIKLTETTIISTVIISIIAIAICIIWSYHILSYRWISDIKFKVLFELEEKLQFAFYTKEATLLYSIYKPKKYKKLTSLEIMIPVTFTFFYIFTLLYSVYIYFN